MQVEIKQRHVADEAVILDVTLTGTHTGAWRATFSSSPPRASSLP